MPRSRFVRLVLLILIGQSHGQAQVNLDSLWNIWKDPARQDTVRLMALHDFTWDGYLYSKPDSALYYAHMMQDYAEQKGLKRFVAGALNLEGSVYSEQGDLTKSFELGERSLKIMEELGYKKGIGMALSNIAGIHASRGEYPQAIGEYQRALAVLEDAGYKPGIIAILLNIGSIYSDFSDDEQALAYYTRALEMAERADDDIGRMGALNNIANLHLNRKEYDVAMAMFERAFALSDTLQDHWRMSVALANIGTIKREQGDVEGAMVDLERSLAMAEELQNYELVSGCLTNIGQGYLDRKQPREAITPCKRSLGIAEELGVLMAERSACICLYDGYSMLGDAPNALHHLERLRVLDDSLQEGATLKKLQRLEFEKEVLADSLAHAEQMRSEQANHEKEVERQRLVRNVLIGGLALVGLFAVVFLFQRNRISKEKKRSEELLLNILPAEVAEELKASGSAAAKHFDQATILFTDFKGFTEASEKLSPQELVEELNTCFKAFDQIITLRGIEKIKTIGDAYMCAGGLPDPKTSSPADVVHAALEMQAFMTSRKTERDAQGLPAFEMRVGIHTGPVVAGIVGVKKFQYDIWGDTVNTASRMESSGEVGQVNISEATYALVKSEAGLSFTPRGKVQAKGKGEMEMYFVKRA
ncbi:MAG: adenylate/guanylate cyclase domain-containing protein [Flavobacteriales bacterium]